MNKAISTIILISMVSEVMPSQITEKSKFGPIRKMLHDANLCSKILNAKLSLEKFPTIERICRANLQAVDGLSSNQIKHPVYRKLSARKRTASAPCVILNYKAFRFC